MKDFGFIFATVMFVITWVVGALGSFAVTAFIALLLVSVAQMLFGVPNDETILYGIFEMMGML